MAGQLTFPPATAALFEPHLPASRQDDKPSRPFVTLTFATSLDSSLSLAPGVRTRLSGPESKVMTHYLRSRHSAILVGVSTLLADDPGLNCRIADATSQPRPIIIDPHLRWEIKGTEKVLQMCRAGAGLAPYVLTAIEPADLPAASLQLLTQLGGKIICVKAAGTDPRGRMRFDWHDVLHALHAEGLTSVMIEGGGQIINSLLEPACHELVDSVIVTIAPTWLGQGGVVVSPPRVRDNSGTPLPAARLSSARWYPLGEDIVLCGKL
ncbi:hypothetical protein S40293_02781 [Stachybotrys chartarum IBT 40293]|nr:hypothetical protein S40293_02781 [Stachybotrys chartarum IBT 40293]